MATLGELLFYIATQNEGSHRSGSGHDNSAKDAKSSVWQVFYYSYANYSSVR
jgi:serine/threonine-protein kinase ULK4